jgi:hypothetical protein
MKLLTNKDKCLELACAYYKKNELEILSQWNIKKKLNSTFSPDSYLFFHYKNDLIPLVLKDNFAFFFGGNLPFNDYNKLTDNKFLLNQSLEYLLNNNIKFRLQSIKNDVYDALNDDHKIFDVPFNQNWIIEDIAIFNIAEFISNQKKKRRNRLKRSQRLLTDYKFLSVDNQSYIANYKSRIFDLSRHSFSIRGKYNCWHDLKDLYDDITDALLSEDLDTVNRILVDKKDTIIASYNLVANKNEIFLVFSNCYNFKINDLQFLLYLDVLEQSSYLAKKYSHKIRLNAARGNFSYKSRMGFKPKPMYCLTNDENWNIAINNDITPKQTRDLYGRSFGCFCKIRSFFE